MRSLIVCLTLVILGTAFAQEEDWASLMREATRHARAGRLKECENTLLRALAVVGTSKGIPAAQTHEALASVYAEQERHPEAVKHYSKALRLREDHTPRRLEVEAHDLYAIAASWRAANRMDQALVSAQLAVERASQAGEQHRLILARAREHLALVLNERHEFVDAEREFGLALLILKQVHPAGHPDIALCQLNRGWNHLDDGRIEAAEELFALAGRMFSANTGASSRQARRARYGLASAMLAKGQLGEAKRAFTKLISEADRTGAKDRADALVSLKLAGLLLDSGLADGVDRLLTRSERFVPIGTRIRRGQLAALRGEPKKAQELFRLAERSLAGAPAKTELVTRLRADALIREGRTKEARSLLASRAAQLRRVMANLHCLIAACDLAESQSAAAAKSARAATQVLTRIGSRRREIFALAEVLFADARLMAGEPDAALSAYQQSQKRVLSLGMPMPELSGRCYLGVARVQRKKGNQAEAIKCFRSAADSFKLGAPLIRQQAVAALTELAELLETSGDHASAKRARTEAKELQ
ncbi:MAG: tetratricopeptide repeat protein [Planctomycetota bacterium]